MNVVQQLTNYYKIPFSETPLTVEIDLVEQLEMNRKKLLTQMFQPNAPTGKRMHKLFSIQMPMAKHILLLHQFVRQSQVEKIYKLLDAYQNVWQMENGVLN